METVYVYSLSIWNSGTGVGFQAFCNVIFGMRDSLVTLQDLVLLQQFSEEKFEPNLAANMIYHHQESLGRSTVGHIGF